MTVYVLCVNEVFDAIYSAPNVWPRLENKGKAIADRYGLCAASEVNRESEETSSMKTLSLPFNESSRTALWSGSGIDRMLTGLLGLEVSKC